jgi:hypothetical protein
MAKFRISVPCGPINQGAKRSQPLSCASPEEKRPYITPGAAEIQV